MPRLRGVANVPSPRLRGKGSVARLFARRTCRATLRKRPTVPAEIVSDPSVMSGAPVVRGTRVQAETILPYLRAGHSKREIFEDYPRLPIDAIDAAIAWAEATYGAA